jgi:hypothetical protein
MRKLFFTLVLLACSKAWSHVPSLLLPLNGTPIASYFIGQIETSRAIYSELTEPGDFFVAHFFAARLQENSFELLTPVCSQIPSSETYQPSALLLKGELPWKQNAETNKDYLDRLEKSALGKAESSYTKGERPQFYEEFGKQNYWVGGKLRLTLDPGLYSLVVFNSSGTGKGNFTLGINDKESWTPDLYEYVSQVLPKINAGLCDPKGFTGSINQ